MPVDTDVYNDRFNPFAAEGDEDSLPDLSESQVVLDNPSHMFDMTEFPISFDEGLIFGAQLETCLGPNPNQTETRTSNESSGRRQNGSNNESSAVVEQPRRREIPVYTVGWSSTDSAQMMPATGLDFLTGIHEIQLQQVVTSLTSPDNSVKRYIIKVPDGETLYTTVENSRGLSRLCCGSQRGFTMSVLDPTQQEAVTFHRTTGCVFGWCPCFLQEIRVFTVGEMYLGSVVQDMALTRSSFTVWDKNRDTLFRIFGPNECVWSVPLDSAFTICGGTGGGRLGIISRRWNDNLGDYYLHICFPASGSPHDHKMLLIAAALLIEYMFFEHRKTALLRIC